MVDDIIRFIIRRGNDRVMAGPKDVMRNGSKHARPVLISRVGVGSHDLIGDAVVHAVSVVLPPSPAKKTIEASIAFPNGGSFEGVQIPDLAVHRSLRFE